MVSGKEGQKSGQEKTETLADVWEAEIKARERLELIRHKLLVMSGKGGVGKSTVAIYLALGLARRGYQVGLLDVDLHGPDIARMLGIKGRLHMGPEGGIQPQSGPENLKVISIEGLLTNRDEPIIWRGPMKHKAIRQLLGEVEWGRLDSLIIDSPPGTGDEPMSVAQVVAEARAVIVTTPQEVALADVRKAINFCRHVNLAVLGLMENMGGLICPHCGGEIHLFRQGGGQKTAAAMGIPFLGTLPFDLRVMEGGDSLMLAVSASWAQSRQRLHYSTLFNPGTIGTVSGEVVRVEHAFSGSGADYCVHALLKTPQGQVTAILASKGYMTAQGLTIAPKDRVTITGSLISVLGKPFILAMEVEGDRTMKLRAATAVRPGRWERIGTCVQSLGK